MHKPFIPLLLCAGLLTAKDPKPVKTAVLSHGVKTPGVLIPYASLKSEAEIALSAPSSGFLFRDGIALASETGIRRFDAKTNKSLEPDFAGIEKPCGGLLSAFSFVWTASCGKSALVKLDLSATAKASPPVFIETGSVPVAPVALAASEDSVWMLSDAKTALLRVDPIVNRIVAEVRLPAMCTSILYAESALWVACPTESRLLRIDPRTNLVDKRIEIPKEPVSLAVGESSIWVLCRKEGKIARIDPKSNKVAATIELNIPNADGMIAFGEGSLWASTPGFPVMRIAPGNDKVAQQFHGDGGGIVQVGLGSVWVSGPKSKSVFRFDPRRIQATLAD